MATTGTQPVQENNPDTERGVQDKKSKSKKEGPPTQAESLADPGGSTQSGVDTPTDK